MPSVFPACLTKIGMNLGVPGLEGKQLATLLPLLPIATTLSDVRFLASLPVRLLMNRLGKDVITTRTGGVEPSGIWPRGSSGANRMGRLGLQTSVSCTNITCPALEIGRGPDFCILRWYYI
jgi:hypothetical protein